MICEGLKTLLSAEATVTAITSEIYVTYAPQRAGLPRLVLDRVDDEKHKAIDGYVSARHAEIDIECWSTTPTKAAALAKVVSDYLDDFSGATGGSETILSSHHMGDSDTFNYDSDGGDITESVCVVNFEFHYTE